MNQQSQAPGVCGACGRVMLECRACAVERVMIGGRVYARLPWEPDREGLPGRGPCGDCGVASGRVHHMHCDMELCPRCTGQQITCGCSPAYPAGRHSL